MAVSAAMRIPARPYSTCLHMPASYVYAAKFHPLHPHLVITGAYDRGIRLWDTGIDSATGQPVQPAEILDDASALHDGILQGFIGGDPHEVAAKGTSSTSHESHVNVVELSVPQDDPGSLRVITADGAGTIMVWTITSSADAAEADSYTLVRCLKPAALRGIPIVSVKMRPGSNQMMVLGHQNILRLFDLGTFGAIRAYPNARCSESHVEICFSPDGMYVCAGGEDGVLCMWSVDKGELTTPRARVDGRRRALIAYPGIMYGTSWHPDQHLVAVCSFGSAYPAMICGAFSTPIGVSE
jgi:WD40 repeat protein